jgi:hypothetical protein
MGGSNHRDLMRYIRWFSLLGRNASSPSPSGIPNGFFNGQRRRP